MGRNINRRQFIQASAAAGAGVWVAGRGAWAQGVPSTSPNEKLNVGFIGISGRGGDDLRETFTTGMVNVAALCDVDDRHLDRELKSHPKAQTYNDFRKLLEQKDIDAVVIGTPDHTHAVAAAAALRLGKHVYCEKPLTHTVHEARVVTQLAAQYKRCTQMGTQIHAGGNYRRVVELVKSGAIGAIGEVHVWCSTRWSADKPPVGEDPVPPALHYDLWVGPAPFHPYNRAYLPASWRRYWAYGDGTLGDMACHYTDLPFWALDLRHPSRISAHADGPADPDCAPEQLRVTWEYEARGNLSPVKLTWYDGGLRPPLFAEWGLNPKWSSGVMFIGAKGNLFADYGQHHLYPEQDFKGFQPPPKSIPDSIGHHKEWVTACLKDDWQGTTCRFEYSGALTEAVLLGNVAYRAGQDLAWDAEAFRITNSPAAQQLLHYEYRKGWEL